MALLHAPLSLLPAQPLPCAAPLPTGSASTPEPAPPTAAPAAPPARSAPSAWAARAPARRACPHALRFQRCSARTCCSTPPTVAPAAPRAPPTPAVREASASARSRAPTAHVRGQAARASSEACWACRLGLGAVPALGKVGHLQRSTHTAPLTPSPLPPCPSCPRSLCRVRLRSRLAVHRHQSQRCPLRRLRRRLPARRRVRGRHLQVHAAQRWRPHKE